MATAQQFVDKCLAEVGDGYGHQEVSPGTPADETAAWDCSELVEVKLRELGIQAPDGSTAQLQWVRDSGTRIPLDAAKRIPGALLLRDGHVAVSLGNGMTVEAKGWEYGVGKFSASGRTFTDGGLVPGLRYPPGTEEIISNEGQDSNTTVTPASQPTLSRGSAGGTVRYLQRRLHALGFEPGPIDGDFGPATQSAVEAFQGDRHLVRDGIVGPRTWAALAVG